MSHGHFIYIPGIRSQRGSSQIDRRREEFLEKNASLRFLLSAALRYGTKNVVDNKKTGGGIGSKMRRIYCY